MGKTTGIEWTDSTWNPIRGCSRVSEGCRHCYAESIAARFSKTGQAYAGLAELRIIGKGTPQERLEPHWTGDVRFIPKHSEDPLRWKAPSKIFVNSMSDLFHEGVKDEWLMKIFAVMAQAPQHTFQVLTKRPERMLDVLSNSEVTSYFQRAHGKWPLPNVWWGVSVEDQPTADERLPILVQCPAAVRMVSYEPALGPIDFAKALGFWTDGSVVLRSISGPNGGPIIHWIICGGESGLNARPMHPEWARSTRDFCANLGIPFFFKQWGEWFPFYDRERDDPDWRKVPKTLSNNERWINLEGGHGFHGERATAIRRVGKHLAAAVLDGVEWRQFPQ